MEASLQLNFFYLHPKICLLILDRKEERWRKRENIDVERNIDWLPPISTLIGDRISNLGMCPDQEANPQPFGLWDNAPTN